MVVLSVKVVGTESNLLTLLHWMGKGPIKAKVDRVDIEWLGSEDEIWNEAKDGFVIAASGKSFEGYFSFSTRSVW